MSSGRTGVDVTRALSRNVGTALRARSVYIVSYSKRIFPNLDVVNIYRPIYLRQTRKGGDPPPGRTNVKYMACEEEDHHICPVTYGVNMAPITADGSC
jgi:hypothetical protein